jgi:NAD+ diphosphatase
MLVTQQLSAGEEPRCLLGRAATWPAGVYSTLAGFVEPGESLEQAVQREVFEEAAIRTEDVRYIASQPWPFPRSIMLGFEAKAVSSDIKIDPEELEDARWFTRKELHTFGNWGDDRYKLQLPRHDSIARYLIDRWMNNQG